VKERESNSSALALVCLFIETVTNLIRAVYCVGMCMCVCVYMLVVAVFHYCYYCCYYYVN